MPRSAGRGLRPALSCYTRAIMPLTYLKYTLSSGYFQNWLVAGPAQRPLSLAEVANSSRTLASLQRNYEAGSGVSEPPADLGPLGPISTEQPLIAWRYYRCRDDHFVDLTRTLPGAAYLRAWAYTELNLPAAADTTLVVTT